MLSVGTFATNDFFQELVVIVYNILKLMKQESWEYKNVRNKFCLNSCQMDVRGVLGYLKADLFLCSNQRKKLKH